MKIIPLHGRGVQGWAVRTGRTHPEGYAFYPFQEGIFMGDLNVEKNRIHWTRDHGETDGQELDEGRLPSGGLQPNGQ